MTRRRDPNYQRLALVITPGARGYRLAYVGGRHFEVLADDLTLEKAAELYRAALAMERTA